MSNSKEEWRKNSLNPALQRLPERQEKFQTDSGIEIDAVYTPEDLQNRGTDYLTDIGFPGEYPYTRGVQPNV